MQRGFSLGQSHYIWKRDGGTCIYCGDFAAVIDHVVPFSKGGKTLVGNGVCCCNKCNMAKKGNLDMDMVTRGLFWLMQHGEDVSWLDNMLGYEKDDITIGTELPKHRKDNKNKYKAKAILELRKLIEIGVLDKGSLSPYWQGLVDSNC